MAVPNILSRRRQLEPERNLNVFLPTPSMIQSYHKLLWRLQWPMLPPAEQKSPFLDIPIDILISISEELSLSTKIVLSQTCKAMWYTLRKLYSLQFNTLVRKDRFKSLTELANLLPDNYHCLKCNSLHPVDLYDTPYWRNVEWPHDSCRALSQFVAQFEPQASYALLFHHVQLALKYSRMKEEHQDYRTNLLQKFEIHPAGSPIKTFTAQPKVVNSRFILLVAYVLDAARVRAAAKPHRDSYMEFCPHHRFGLGTGPRQPFASMLKDTATIFATKQGQYTNRVSCVGCPTDFSIAVLDDEVVVKAWHDLWEGLSIEDPSWQCHVRPMNPREWGAPRFEYEPGSISQMYESCCN